MNLKKIDPLTHTVVDYLLVLFFWLSPSLFNFGGTVALVIYIYGFLYFLLTVATISPLGLVKFIPLSTHAWVEFGLGLALIVLPWIINFNEDLKARNYFISTGVGIICLWVFSNYKNLVKRSDN